GVPEETRVRVLNVYAGRACPQCCASEICVTNIPPVYRCAACGEQWVPPLALMNSRLLQEREVVVVDGEPLPPRGWRRVAKVDPDTVREFRMTLSETVIVFNSGRQEALPPT